MTDLTIKSTVSVVIPHYNHGAFISRAIQSVEQQEVSPCQIIIIDDASTDGSAAVLDSIARVKPGITYVKHSTNQGANATINEGLRLATGDYALVLAADDWILPGLFEQSLQLLDHFPEAGLASTLSFRANASGTITGPYSRAAPVAWHKCYLTPSQVAHSLKRGLDWFVGNTTLFKRKALLEIGGFRSELRSFGDGFACRVLSLQHGACFVPRPLAVFRVVDNSMSAETRKSAKAYMELLLKASALVRESYANSLPIDLATLLEAHGRYCLTIEECRSRTFHLGESAWVKKDLQKSGSSEWLRLNLMRMARNILYYCRRAFIELRFKRSPRNAILLGVWRLWTSATGLYKYGLHTECCQHAPRGSKTPREELS